MNYYWIWNTRVGFERDDKQITKEMNSDPDSFGAKLNQSSKKYSTVYKFSLRHLEC